MKKALITGISGQDGSYLAEHLLGSGYEVHGLVRNNNGESLWRIQSIVDRLTLHTCSLEDHEAIAGVFKKVQPDECYHLAAQSFVSNAFEDELATMTTNLNGTHHVLSGLKENSPECRFFFAGSSEMFGNAETAPQNESTPFHPRSIYGVSKVCGYELTRHYREAHGIFACAGILYNHESPRRGAKFVTRKITSLAVKINLGIKKKLPMGNIEARRDWGFAGDYVKAMHAMLVADKPDDYVVATGITHSVKEVLEIAFGELEMDYKDYVLVDPSFFRANESKTIMGDSSKLKNKLGWEPQMKFEDMIRQMVRSDFEHFKNSQ